MAIQSANPPELHTWGPWKGLNQQAGRGAIDDDEEWWNENFFAIGPGNLRTCWGKSAPVYTAPSGKTIRRIFFGFIGDITAINQSPPPGQYGWMFLSDGTIDQVDLNTKNVVHVGGAGFQVWNPIAPQYWASAKVWRPRFLGNHTGQQGGVLFGSPEIDSSPGVWSAGGLMAWDGVTLSPPGSPAPDWLTSGLEVSPGVPFTMPIGLPGIYCMEVYQSRLFVAGQDVISFTAPSNGADFATADGGGSIGYLGDKLRYSYMDMAESAGYLYIFGDSSIDMINNVQIIGGGTPQSPLTTNLSYTNIDPQIGHRFPRPVGRIGRYFQMYNGAGIFEMRGAEGRQISQKITNIYVTLDTSQYLPTMCPATMFGFRVLLCNGRFTDTFGVTRNLLLMWHPTQGSEFWSIASQAVPPTTASPTAQLDLTNIGAYEQDSIITPYGTDGTSLYQLFAAPDPNLLKHLSTKYLRGNGLSQLTIKNWKRLYMEFFDNSRDANGNASGIEIVGFMTTQGGGIPNGVHEVNFQLSPGSTTTSNVYPGLGGPGGGAGTTPVSGFEPQPLQAAGIAAAVDIQSQSPDFTIERLHVTTEERVLWGA
jgi:hypothetical protein